MMVLDLSLSALRRVSASSRVFEVDEPDYHDRLFSHARAKTKAV